MTRAKFYLSTFIFGVSLYLGEIYFANVATFASNNSASKGWLLEQDNPHTGMWTVYMSNEGVAAQNKKVGCTLVTKAPQWSVVMYNEKTKVYFMSPLSEWKGASLKSTSSKSKQAYKSMLLEKKPKKLKEGDILGHKSQMYLTDNLASTGLKKVEFWITPDVQAPKEFKQLLSKIYGIGLTTLSGMPLKVSYIDENGKRTPVFTTTKIESKVLPMSTFSYPASYKRVDNEIAVIMDEKGQKAMADIMDDVSESTDGEDIEELLGSGHKTAYKGKSDKADSEKDNETDALLDDSSIEAGNPDDKPLTSESNNTDIFKQFWDWIISLLKQIGLWK